MYMLKCYVYQKTLYHLVYMYSWRINDQIIYGYTIYNSVIMCLHNNIFCYMINYLKNYHKIIYM